MQCLLRLTRTGVFKEPGKRQGRRHGTHRYFGSDRFHTFRARRCVDHILLYSRSQRRTHIGYFVFAAFASAFMLKVRDRPLYRRMEQASVLTSLSLASAPRMFEVHHAGSRIRDLSGHRAPHQYIWVSADSNR